MGAVGRDRRRRVERMSDIVGCGVYTFGEEDEE